MGLIPQPINRKCIQEFIVKIPHLKRIYQSRYYRIISAALKANGNKLPLTVNLGTGGGFPGDRKIEISSSPSSEFDSDVTLDDWTFFPARIRAASTVLRDNGHKGTFQISHHNGSLIIS